VERRSRPRLQDKLSNLNLILITLALVAALLILWYYLSQDSQIKADFLFEGVKYLMQLVLIVLLGGILLQQYTRARDSAEEVTEFRKDILAALMRAYNDTKKVRRILKGSTVLKEQSSTRIYEIPRKIYEEQIQKLMDPQLEFEFYKKQLTALDDVFTDTERVRYQLEKLEKYLNAIIKEYDSRKGAYKNLKSRDAASVPTNSLPNLADFLSGTKFNEQFANIFDSTAKDVRKEILENQP